MARIENGSQANTGLKGSDQAEVYLVVDNVSGLPMINGVDDFIVAIIFIAVEVLGLATVSW